MKPKTTSKTKQTESTVILTLEIKAERKIKIKAEAEYARFKWAENTYSLDGVHHYTPGTYKVFIEARQLKSLDFIDCSCIRAEISNCPELKIISCQVNAIAELSIRECGKLTALYCSNNCLTALDVSSVANIRELHCEKNNLHTLNLSGCKDLTTLYCHHNQLQELDISDCETLAFLDVEYNLLSADSLNTIFKVLPRYPELHGLYSYKINHWNNPGTNACDTSLLEDKSWEIELFLN